MPVFCLGRFLDTYSGSMSGLVNCVMDSAEKEIIPGRKGLELTAVGWVEVGQAQRRKGESRRS